MINSDHIDKYGDIHIANDGTTLATLSTTNGRFTPRVRMALGTQGKVSRELGRLRGEYICKSSLELEYGVHINVIAVPNKGSISFMSEVVIPVLNIVTRMEGTFKTQMESIAKAKNYLDFHTRWVVLSQTISNWELTEVGDDGCYITYKTEKEAVSEVAEILEDLEDEVSTGNIEDFDSDEYMVAKCMVIGDQIVSHLNRINSPVCPI